jgi:hypothetical protein
MSTTARAAALAAAFLAPLAAPGQPPESKRDREYLRDVRAEATELLRALERLEEDIIDELGGQTERKLYRQTESAISAAAAFVALLADGVSRGKLYAAFAKLDARLHQLTDAVDALKPESRALRRAASRVRAADDHLHYLLSVGDTSDARSATVLKRQAAVLADAAEGLERVASYAIGTAPGRAPLLQDLAKLAKSAKHFADRLEKGAARQDVGPDFEALTKVWDKVTGELQRLAPAEHLYFLRTASQFDRVHERLYRLLGLKGKRPQLIIRT